MKKRLKPAIELIVKSDCQPIIDLMKQGKESEAKVIFDRLAKKYKLMDYEAWMLGRKIRQEAGANPAR